LFAEDLRLFPDTAERVPQVRPRIMKRWGGSPEPRGSPWTRQNSDEDVGKRARAPAPLSSERSLTLVSHETVLAPASRCK